MTNVVNIYTCLSNYTNPISTQLNVITLYIRLAKLCHEVVSFVCCLDAVVHRQSHWNQERRNRSRKSGFLHKGPNHSGVQFSPDGLIKFNRSETQGLILKLQDNDKACYLSLPEGINVETTLAFAQEARRRYFHEILYFVL